MALHRELSTKLRLADQIRESNKDFLENENNADGFYFLVQDIVAKYGDSAFDIAEELFRQENMVFDSAELRKSGSVNRIGYVFEGININDIVIEKYNEQMVKDILWLFNNQVRLISKELIMKEDELLQIYSENLDREDGIFVAYNVGRQRVGFVHCMATKDGEGSIEALFFLSGRFHTHVGNKLIEKAKEYFISKNVSQISVLENKVGYYKNMSQIKNIFQQKLPHIYSLLGSISQLS